MTRIEAESVELAFIKAAKELGCSVTELDFEVIQEPTKGVFGLFKKNAVVIAVRSESRRPNRRDDRRDERRDDRRDDHREERHEPRDRGEEKRDDRRDEKRQESRDDRHIETPRETTRQEPKYETKYEPKYDPKFDSKFETKFDPKPEPRYETKFDPKPEPKELKYETKFDPKPEPKIERPVKVEPPRKIAPKPTVDASGFLDSTFADDDTFDRQYPEPPRKPIDKLQDRVPEKMREKLQERAHANSLAKPLEKIHEKPQYAEFKAYSDHSQMDAIVESFDHTNQDSEAVCVEIEATLRQLFSHTCYQIETIEVSMYDEKTIKVFFDGIDAALLIGKDGYRYKALSYILFNWINPTYGYLLRFEIAEFLHNQEEMIARYLEPVIAQIRENGKGQTRVLDGVLVQIALRELRLEFPGKYVAIKTAQNGDGKYVVVNDFIRKYDR